VYHVYGGIELGDPAVLTSEEQVGHYALCIMARVMVDQERQRPDTRFRTESVVVVVVVLIS
jgi:hypothetical protein